MRQVRSHYSMEGIGSEADRPTQRIGESTEKILQNVGDSDEEISKFSSRRIVK